MQKLEARLTEVSAYPVQLKMGDGETLVTGDVALDVRTLIVFPEEFPKLFQKLCKAGTLSIKVSQEATKSG